MFVRTCQECGYRQVSKNPSEYKNDAWRNLKCKKCQSEALDYGSEGWNLNKDGKLEREEEDHD